MHFTQRREVHEVFEVVIACTRYQIVIAFLEVHPFQEVIEHGGINGRIVNETHGFSLLALFESFFHFLNHAGIKIFEQIEFGIAREFYGPCLKRIVRENVKDIFKAVPDYIIEQNDVALFAVSR